MTISFPKVRGVPCDPFDEFSEASNLFVGICYIKKEQLRVFWTNYPPTNKNMHGFARSVLLAESIPEFFKIQEDEGIPRQRLSLVPTISP